MTGLIDLLIPCWMLLVFLSVKMGLGFDFGTPAGVGNVSGVGPFNDRAANAGVGESDSDMKRDVVFLGERAGESTVSMIEGVRALEPLGVVSSEVLEVSLSSLSINAD